MATFLVIASALLLGVYSQSIPITNPVVDLYGNLTEYQWTNTMVYNYSEIVFVY